LKTRFSKAGIQQCISHRSKQSNRLVARGSVYFPFILNYKPIIDRFMERIKYISDFKICNIFFKSGKLTHLVIVLLIMNTMMCCQHAAKQKAAAVKGTFAYDRQFIEKYDTSILTISSGDAQVLISAKYQGKVFTSTAAGDSGHSFGWINYRAFEGPLDPHMNAYGGENRFWLGPEGGIYSLFFPKGKNMSFENWKTPAAFDNESWQFLSKDSGKAVLFKDMKIQNYAGTDFHLNVKRTITILSEKAIESLLNINIGPKIQSVAYQTENEVTNTGQQDWSQATGMPCIWILDMFPPSGKTTVVIPCKEGNGSPATTNYFGEIPSDRIKLVGSTVFFKADGKQRGKLGIHPDRAKDIAGSYDAENKILTIIQYSLESSAKYLNQEWRTDKPVFSGDAMNAYNDGPLSDGKQMGPFYELESVSSALFLPISHTTNHYHAVYHFTGSEEQLSNISEKLLGVNIQEIKQAF
jgi:hypothetical protein